MDKDLIALFSGALFITVLGLLEFYLEGNIETKAITGIQHAFLVLFIGIGMGNEFGKALTKKCGRWNYFGLGAYTALFATTVGNSLYGLFTQEWNLAIGSTIMATSGIMVIGMHRAELIQNERHIDNFRSELSQVALEGITVFGVPLLVFINKIIPGILSLF